MHNFAKNTRTTYIALFKEWFLHQIQRQCLEFRIILWLFCLLVFLYIPDIVNNVTGEYFCLDENKFNKVFFGRVFDLLYVFVAFCIRHKTHNHGIAKHIPVVYSGQIFKETLRKRRSLTWGSPEVLSVAPIVPILGLT
jgi:hypothetical protein